jgi:acetyltransferase
LGIPALTSPSALASALIALVHDAIGRSRRGTPATTTPRSWSLGPWDEDQAKSQLDSWGITTPRRRRYAERAEAQSALATLTPPVAVKILDARVLHKTDIGGVHLGVHTNQELSAALDSLEEIGAKQFLVESMAPSGVDLVVGVRRDAVFGPVAMVGLGGAAAEVYGDVAIRTVPAPPAEIAAMIDDLKVRPLLDGWRGGPVLDRSDLVVVVTALSDALLSAPHVDEIEINPLRLTDDGLIALDAVIIRGSEVNDAPADH